MRRNLVDTIVRFPGLYRHDLLRFRIKALGWSELEASRRANMHPYSLRRILAGQATGKTVWPVAQLLGLDWAMLHNFDLQESDFHLAVLGSGKRAAE